MAILLTTIGAIQVIDPNTGTLSVSKNINQSFNGFECQQGESLLYGTTPTAVALPSPTTAFVFISNLSTINSCTVTWTFTGGSSINVCTLQPLGSIMLSENTTASGVTSLSLQCSGTNTPIDLFLAG
jgi:hypothetical protein